MYTVPELKLNKFNPVAIPDNKTFFGRFGETSPLANQYSGDENIPENSSKIDTLRATDAEYNKFLRENPEPDPDSEK